MRIVVGIICFIGRGFARLPIYDLISHQSPVKIIATIKVVFILVVLITRWSLKNCGASSDEELLKVRSQLDPFSVESLNPLEFLPSDRRGFHDIRQGCLIHEIGHEIARG